MEGKPSWIIRQVHGLRVSLATLIAQAEANEKALKVQAAEYERRLNLLNGEAARLREIQATYLPREVFENKLTELNKELLELKTYKDNTAGRQAIVALVIPTVVSLMFAAFNYFVMRK
jgi:hypothetical protein